MTMRKHLMEAQRGSTMKKPFSCCVTLNKLLNLSEPQLLHLLKQGRGTGKSIPTSLGFMRIK